MSSTGFVTLLQTDMLNGINVASYSNIPTLEEAVMQACTAFQADSSLNVFCYKGETQDLWASRLVNCTQPRNNPRIPSFILFSVFF